MIPITIHGFLPPSAINSEGRLLPSEQVATEVWIPKPIRAAHSLPTTGSSRRERGMEGYTPVLVEGLDAAGRSHSEDDGHFHPVLSVPYTGWRVDDALHDPDAAAVVDDKGYPVITFHQHHPDGHSPTQQARAYLNALRKQQEPA